MPHKRYDDSFFEWMRCEWIFTVRIIHFWFISLTNLWTYKTVCASLLLSVCECVRLVRKEETRNVKTENSRKKSRAFAHYYNEIKTKIAKHSDTGAIKLLYKKLIDKRTRRAHTHTPTNACVRARKAESYRYWCWYSDFSVCLFVCLPYMRLAYIYHSKSIFFFAVTWENIHCTHQLKWSIEVPTNFYCSPHSFLLVLSSLALWSWIYELCKDTQQIRVNHVIFFCPNCVIKIEIVYFFSIYYPFIMSHTQRINKTKTQKHMK